MRELCSRLVQLPPATNGMALGLCGAASVLLELGADERAALCVMIPRDGPLDLILARMLAAPGQARDARHAAGVLRVRRVADGVLVRAARVVAGMSLAAAGAMVFLGALLQALILAALPARLRAHAHGARAVLEPADGELRGDGDRGRAARARGAAVPAWLISARSRARSRSSWGSRRRRCGASSPTTRCRRPRRSR